MTMTAAELNNPKTVKIRCVRAKFFVAGKLAEVDAVYTLPHGDAQRLIDAGHAELVA